MHKQKLLLIAQIGEDVDMSGNKTSGEKWKFYFKDKAI